MDMMQNNKLRLFQRIPKDCPDSSRAIFRVLGSWESCFFSLLFISRTEGFHQRFNVSYERGATWNVSPYCKRVFKHSLSFSEVFHICHNGLMVKWQIQPISSIHYVVFDIIKIQTYLSLERQGVWPSFGIANQLTAKNGEDWKTFWDRDLQCSASNTAVNLHSDGCQL